MTDGYLPFIKEISDRAPKLEYVGVLGFDELHCGKRVSGEWVLCTKAEFNEAPTCYERFTPNSATNHQSFPLHT